MRKVGIIMGSDSDLPVVRKAADTVRALDIPYEAHGYSWLLYTSPSPRDGLLSPMPSSA